MAHQTPHALLANRSRVSLRVFEFLQLRISQNLKSEASAEQSHGQGLDGGVVSCQYGTLMMKRCRDRQGDDGLKEGLGQECLEESLVPIPFLKLFDLVPRVVVAFALTSSFDTPTGDAIKETPTPKGDACQKESLRP